MKDASGKHPLRRWRQREGLTLHRMAERLQQAAGRPVLSVASITRIELGQQPPSAGVLALLAQVTGGEVAPNECVAFWAQRAQRRQLEG